MSGRTKSGQVILPHVSARKAENLFESGAPRRAFQLIVAIEHGIAPVQSRSGLH